MATSTIDANPGDTSILEDDHDPDLSLETSDDPVSDFLDSWKLGRFFNDFYRF